MEMFTETQPLTPSPLLKLWHDLTMRTVWRHPGDWLHPAAEALVEALESGEDPTVCAERLGAVRAQGGAGIVETIDDLLCLYRAIDAEAPTDVVRALSAGWVAAREARPDHHTFIEPVSGLQTAEYLGIRLRETYGQAARLGLTATDTHCVLIINVALDSDAIADRFKRATTMGVILRDLFGEGYPMASLSDGLYAVLLERDATLGQRISRIREALAKPALELSGQPVLRQPAQLWIEPLPQDANECLMILDDVRR